MTITSPSGSNRRAGSPLLLRQGGFLIGRGKPDRTLEKFVADTGSTIVRADFPGAGPRWIVEKGLGEPA